MTRLTTEQLIEQASHNLLLMKSQLSEQHSNIALMADLKLMEIAITALESKPFAYMHRSGQVVTRDECSCEEVFEICCKVDTPLYTEPVLPKQPESRNEIMAKGVEAFAKDWKGSARYSRISEMACNFAAKLRNGDADEC